MKTVFSPRCSHLPKPKSVPAELREGSYPFIAMETENRGLDLEKELTCSVSWPPIFLEG
jgi:hypothetical protein